MTNESKTQEEAYPILPVKADPEGMVAEACNELGGVISGIKPAPEVSPQELKEITDDQDYQDHLEEVEAPITDEDAKKD